MAGDHSQGDPHRHDTEVRRRKGSWTASCTCGWVAPCVSSFVAWSATRRHLTEAGGPDAPLSPPPRRATVRLLEPN